MHIPTEIRAERLRVLVEVAPYLPLEPEDIGRFVTAEDAEIVQQVGTEDLNLANACLAVETELRRRQITAVEQLTALVPAGEGSLDERVLALPIPQRMDAFAATSPLCGLTTNPASRPGGLEREGVTSFVVRTFLP